MLGLLSLIKELGQPYYARQKTFHPSPLSVRQARATPRILKHGGLVVRDQCQTKGEFKYVIGGLVNNKV